MEDRFTREEAAEILGVTPRQLTFMRTKGRIVGVPKTACKWPDYMYTAEAIERCAQGLPPIEPVVEQRPIEVKARSIVIEREAPRKLSSFSPNQDGKLSPDIARQAAKLLE